MKNYQLEVIKEKDLLDKKIDKLDRFLCRKQNLSNEDYDMLDLQLNVMELYSRLLFKRIRKFTKRKK